MKIYVRASISKAIRNLIQMFPNSSFEYSLPCISLAPLIISFFIAGLFIVPPFVYGVSHPSVLMDVYLTPIGSSDGAD